MTQNGDAQKEESGGRRSALGWAAVGVIAVLDWLLFDRFVRPILARDPLVTFAAQTRDFQRAAQGLADGGRLWTYDPLFNAGQPAGLVEGGSARGLAAASVMTSPPEHADWTFRVAIVLISLSIPLLGYVTARRVGFARSAGLLAALLWLLAWYFDSAAHWLWYSGRFGWCAGAPLAILAVTGLVTARRASWRSAAAWIVVACLCAGTLAIVHPVSLLAVIPPAIVVALRSKRAALGVGVSALATAAGGAFWWSSAFDVPFYAAPIRSLAATLEVFVFDAFDLLYDHDATGAPVRTALRFVALTAAGVALWRWRRAGDDRFAPWLAFLGAAFVLTYAGGHIPGLSDWEPYGFVLMATLVAAVPASTVLVDTFSPASLKRAPPGVKIVLGLALLAVVPRFVRTVLQYSPDVLPKPVRYFKSDDVPAMSLVGMNEPQPHAMAFETAPLSFVQLREWLRTHPAPGRIAIDHWGVAEFLAATTDLALIGGLEESNVPGAEANPFTRPPGALRGPGLGHHLDRYAIAVVVLSGDVQALDHRPDVLQRVGEIDDFRIYRAPQTDYFVSGRGRLESQRPGAVVVDGARGDLVLKLHFHPSLRCRPDCEVQPLEHGTATPFVRVPDAPPRFELFNAYY